MRAIREVETGSTIFVQSCVRMMSAAWIKLQMVESSAGSRRPRATMASISGIAYSMRYTIASDIGMAFELGIKTVMQGLSPKEDGKPQVPNSHDLLADLWEGVPEDIRSEIDASAASWVGNVFGPDNAAKVLPFSRYLGKHTDFLNRVVDNRYAIEPDQGRGLFRSIVRFVTMPISPIVQERYNGSDIVDGAGVLMSYWWAIMKKAGELRWEEERCEADETLAADRDDAWNLVDRAVNQMLGNLKIMTREERQEELLRSFTQYTQ